jgi:hypothetical protein
MTDIDLSDLVANMLSAAGDSLKDKWPESKDYAESEFKKIGETIIFISQEVLAGRMSEEKAKLHLEMQKIIIENGSLDFRRTGSTGSGSSD